MEPAWTCRTPEEASQEGRSHVHTSTAPTSANEQHCRRWIGTPNCATFAAHKAGRLQALVDQSSSRIGRQEDRMHQATVSEIAVSCLAPRASATNDIAIARIYIFTRRRGANTAHTQMGRPTHEAPTREYTHKHTQTQTNAQRGPTKYGAGSRRGAALLIRGGRLAPTPSELHLCRDLPRRSYVHRHREAL